MIDDKTRLALFLELHRVVEEQTERLIERIKARKAGDRISYFSERLKSEEIDALHKIPLSPAAASALQKVVVDACGKVLFHFFCVLDGVGSPDDFWDWSEGPWLGACLAEASGKNAGDLHDFFFQSYEDYLEHHRQ